MELWLYTSRTSNECVLCFRHWDHLTTVARNIGHWILNTAAQANSYLTFRVWVREITTQLLGSIHSQGGRS